MSDCSNSCIHSRRYDLASSTTSEWPVYGKPVGLSVTPTCNLLVTCLGEPNTLVELSADSGQCVREVELQADIKWPWHSVQLTSGQFVVCHGHGDNSLHRVCVVGDNGKVTCTPYGNELGSDDGQLRGPRHLAVDKDSQSIFVADYYNGRVVLLSPTLEFVRYISGRLSYSWRLHLHQTTRSMFVAPLCNGVVNPTVQI